MKKVKSLIILLIVLVFVIVGYIVATVIARKEEEKNIVPEETRTVLLSGDEETVTKLSYQGNGTAYSLEKEKDVWYLAGDHAFPLDQSAADAMAAAAADVTSSRRITEDRASFAEYGLDTPAHSVTVSFGEKENTIYIGDYNKSNKMYYANMKGTDTVYVISGDLLTAFDTTVKELIVNEKLTLPTDGFDAVTLADFTFRDGTGYSYLREGGTEAVTDESGNETVPATPDSFRKILSDGTEEEGDFTDAFTEQYDNITALDFTDWAAYAVTEEDDLAAYGLADPFCRVNITYNETVTLSADDNSTSTTTTVSGDFGLLIGDLISEETAEADTAAVDSGTETNGKTEAETSDVPVSDTGSGSDEIPETDSSDSDSYRYVMIKGGRIVYKISAEDIAVILATE